MAIDLERLEKRIDKWLAEETEDSLREWLLERRKEVTTSTSALPISGVVLSEERADVCQSFVVDTTTSSATICANCKKEAWEHGQT